MAGAWNACCQYAYWVVPGFEGNETRKDMGATRDASPEDVREVFAGKKYKPVAQKVCTVFELLPKEYRIKHVGDPLASLVPLDV